MNLLVLAAGMVSGSAVFACWGLSIERPGGKPPPEMLEITQLFALGMMIMLLVAIYFPLKKKVEEINDMESDEESSGNHE